MSLRHPVLCVAVTGVAVAAWMALASLLWAHKGVLQCVCVAVCGAVCGEVCGIVCVEVCAETCFPEMSVATLSHVSHP